MAKEKVETTETPKVAAAPAPKQSNTALKVVLIVIGVFVLLGIMGAVTAGYLVKKAAEKVTGITATNDTASLNLGGNNNITAGENVKWPDSMPTIVPKFTAGKLTASSRIGDAWTVTADTVTKANVTAYKAVLTSAGWVNQAESEVELGTMISSSYKKSGYTLNITFTEEDGAFMVTVTKDSV